ncbi:hypothetical protein [Lentilactobacillus sp. Marseille-Q4993]|uniref:hypothetical protein n=1 Tax=Lentilactobacillus sp. Marseille-Q4993 TaxID=3039492 RepID=UPI0024BD3099|nr:hypothetical protein [Lentilactobacillus sp. Marseille-Q4993]
MKKKYTVEQIEKVNRYMNVQKLVGMMYEVMPEGDTFVTTHMSLYEAINVLVNNGELVELYPDEINEINHIIETPDEDLKLEDAYFDEEASENYHRKVMANRAEGLK